MKESLFQRKAEMVRQEDYQRQDDDVHTPNLYNIYLAEEKATKKILCDIEVPKKFTSKKLYFMAPSFPTHPVLPGGGLIPMKIHQSWFEPVTTIDYPNLSRISNSWKIYERDGWSYNFYTDDQAASFISQHFSSEVLDAFDSLLPGAYKADLFRYCVLFIEGGIWADIDTLLTTNLNVLIPDDVGFLVPLDFWRGLLWNGLVAAAPGHPFLAKAIERSVNFIRNRFTVIDICGQFCPELDNMVTLRDHPDLYLTGPGLLGMTVNEVLHLPKANPYKAGYVDECEKQSHVPGRCMLLQHLDKDLSSARRFTLVPANILVGETGVEGAVDKQSTNRHYGPTPGVYWGTEGVYTDTVYADEEIRIFMTQE